MFFVSLMNAAELVYEGDIGPNLESLIASYDAALQALAQNVETQPLPVDLSAELTKQIEAAGLADNASGLLSQIAEMQKQLEALSLLPPPAQLAEMQKQIDALDLLPPPSQGTVVDVTATDPVASSRGIAPNISLNAAYGDTLNPYAAKTANFVLAGPTSGAAAVPAFRALVASDIPVLPYVTSVSGTAGRITSTGGTTPVIDLASGVATPGTTGSSTQVPVITIDTYGRVTSITTAANPQGTVTSVAVSGGTTGLTTSGGPITTSGTITFAGTLVAANGGTGQSSYAVGDILYASSSTALSKLADVATGNALISGGVGVAPSYGKIGLTTHVSGTLPTANGGTNLTSFTAKGVVYASSTSALATGTAFVFDGSNVGIGVSSPSYRLDVNSGSGAFSARIASTTTDTILLFNDSGTTGLGPYIGSSGNNLTFGRAGVAERLRIDASGIVTMSAYGAGAATFSAAGVISSVSDETWKTKDGVPVNPDAMLKKLAPGYWYYNEEKRETFGKDRQLGFYAQNVNDAIGPEAAPAPEEGKPWGYYDRSVLAVVVMSLQNALDTIDSLTARIAALEQK
tara:strand:+ start:228 stop:1946 length:1719 start_codon:yes stop_codon:yes gene_type:complete